jgi:hypothetical protein
LAVLGPEDLSLNVMAQIRSEVLSKSVRFQQISFEAYKAQFIKTEEDEWPLLAGQERAHVIHFIRKRRARRRIVARRTSSPVHSRYGQRGPQDSRTG